MHAILLALVSHVLPVAVTNSLPVGCKDVRSYAMTNGKIAWIIWDTRKHRLLLRGREPGSGTLAVVKKDGTSTSYVIVVLPKTTGERS